jgi:hypothetical protein
MNHVGLHIQAEKAAPPQNSNFMEGLYASYVITKLNWLL